MTLTAGQPKKPVPPHCSECGASKPMAVLRPGAEPDALGGRSSHVWLCGDCLYRLEHPDALKAVKPPRARSCRLQKECLFDDV
jgi:hypothetical protein